MNVLIVNAYSARNRGDGMIVSQMVRQLGARSCSVRVMSDDPGDEESYGVPWVAPLVPTQRMSGIPLARPALARNLARGGLKLRPRSLRWADAVIGAGGGYFYDDGSRASRLNLLLRLLPVRAAARMDLPTAHFPMSIGPFASAVSANVTAAALRGARLVVAREEDSRRFCASRGVRVALCDDIAFCIRPDGTAAPPEVPEGAVGLTALASLPGPAPDSVVARYHEALCEGVATSVGDRPVCVISQVAAHATDTDVPVGRELTRQLARRGVDARFVDLSNRSDEEVAAAYGRLSLLVASRLHSAIFALVAGTPAIGLAYLPKTDGVLGRLGLSDLVLPAAGLDPVALGKLVTRCLHDEAGQRARVRAGVAAARRSAEAATDMCLAAVTGS